MFVYETVESTNRVQGMMVLLYGDKIWFYHITTRAGDPMR